MLEAGAIFTEAGLEYFGEIIWDKGAPGLGYTVRYAHESCLLFCKGKVESPEQAALSIVRFPVSHVDTQSRHPHEKPTMFWTNLMKLAPAGKLILDPFMGSGPTLRAAKDLGRKAVGIELDERWCEMAAQSMAQEVLPL